MKLWKNIRWKVIILRTIKDNIIPTIIKKLNELIIH